MTTVYPDAIDTYSTKVDNVTDVLAAHINDPQDAITTIERVIGINAENFPARTNFLYHSLTHDDWLEGTTFNDIADDSYVANVWTVLHDGNTPDISGVAGGSTDPFSRYFRCTFDANGRAGLVQFLENKDTVRLRGKKVSLEFDAWGTGVSNLRAALLSWTGTADSITSDVVATWGTNPTLATNWAYVTTPSASEAIIGSLIRLLPAATLAQTVPTNCNNLAVFIWTPDTEGLGDLFNIANVALIPGDPFFQAREAVNFVARSFAEELTLSQRYYYKTFPLATAPAQNAGSSGAFKFIVSHSGASSFITDSERFPVAMRVAPTIVTYNTSAANAEMRNTATGTDCSSTTTASVSESEFTLVATSPSGTTAGHTVECHITANARL